MLVDRFQNLNPRSPGPNHGQRADASTPPGIISGSLGLRTGQHASFDPTPLSRFSPNNRPALSQQRDHSDCLKSGSPLTLKVRKTRENLRDCDAFPDILPPCLHPLRHPASEAPFQEPPILVDLSEREVASSLVQEEAAVAPQPLHPLRRKSASRRMFSKVKEGLSSRSRSYQPVRLPESDSSLMRRLSGRWKDDVNTEKRAHSFEISRDSFDFDSVTSPPETNVPYVELQVLKDRTYVDAACSKDFIVTIDAMIRGRQAAMSSTKNQSIAATSRLPDQEIGDRECTVGSITSLRLCYKPMNGCTVTEMAGQKTVKNLRIGQRCCLSLKVRVPKIRTTASPSDGIIDQDALFAELESMLGILEFVTVQIEVKYRHSLLAADNVVTVRKVCSITRPRGDCPWGMIPPLHLSRELTTISNQPALVVTDTDEGDAPQTDGQDSARQVWRHIRRSSLSAYPLGALDAGKMQQIESNESIRALKAKALANKRSVGAETLMGWQWEDKKLNGEAPWL